MAHEDRSAVVLASLLLLAPAAFAQNLAANPDFNAGASSWAATLGTPSWLETDDADGCYGSGLLRVASEAGDGAQATVVQCVPLADGGTLNARLLHRAPATFTVLQFDFYPDPSCAETPLEQDVSKSVGATTGWEWFAYSHAVPKGAQAVLFQYAADYNDGTPFDADLDRIWVGVGDPIFFDDFEARSTCRWSVAQVPCDDSYLSATSFPQGNGAGPLEIGAYGTAWVTFVNADGTHHIYATNDDDNVDLQMEVFYPQKAFDGCSMPDFVWNDQGTGTGLQEEHNTDLDGVAPIPAGDVYIRIRNLAGIAGQFDIYDSD